MEDFAIGSHIKCACGDPSCPSGRIINKTEVYYIIYNDDKNRGIYEMSKNMARLVKYVHKTKKRFNAIADSPTNQPYVEVK